MQTRRQLLGTALPIAALPLARLDPTGARRALRAIARYDRSPEEAASDESFWFEVQQAFTVDRSLVNLNNGGVSPSPAIVQDAMKRHLDFSNEAPSYTMWRILEPRREVVRERLARYAGCDPEELALVRNASEGVQICQFGIDLAPGDEVLTTNQDYPRMLACFRQRERREGLKLELVSIPVPAEDPREVVARFEERITERTRLILCCHVVNLTGQILPVRDIARMAHARGIRVLVDGAHSFSHFPFTLPELECDYFATSLHKWTFAPHGTGLLFVRRELIESLWPMMAADEELKGDIRKFEQIGTHPAAPYLAIAEALFFNQGIGLERKAARLRFLRDRWARRLAGHDRVRLHTSLSPEHSCGIATVELDGIDPGKLNGHLFEEHRIIVTPIQHDEFQGIRVTPSVYTTLEEIDRFIDAMETVIERGLPE